MIFLAHVSSLRIISETYYTLEPPGSALHSGNDRAKPGFSFMKEGEKTDKPDASSPPLNSGAVFCAAVWGRREEAVVNVLEGFAEATDGNGRVGAVLVPALSVGVQGRCTQAYPFVPAQVYNIS